MYYLQRELCMYGLVMKKFKLPNPIFELGKIVFKEPLELEVMHIAKETIEFVWPFGMPDTVGRKNNFILGYSEDKRNFKYDLTRHCSYHIGHAFFHYELDPNYTHYHWALLGHLKPLAIEIDEEWGLD